MSGCAQTFDLSYVYVCVFFIYLQNLNFNKNTTLENKTEWGNTEKKDNLFKNGPTFVAFVL